MANRRKGTIARRKRRREGQAATGARVLRVMAAVTDAKTQVRVIRKRGYVVLAVLWLGDRTMAWRPRSGIGPR